MAISEALTKVTRNGQITLPARLRRAVNIKEGDYIAVRVEGDSLVLTAQKLIDKSQAYYWTEEWQKAEREADEDLREGRYVTFDSVEELIADLHRQVEEHEAGTPSQVQRPLSGSRAGRAPASRQSASVSR